MSQHDQTSVADGCAAPTFISWSGTRARTFGIALQELLNTTGDHFDPWMSDRDIPLGVNWRDSVVNRLQSAAAGVVLLTLENYRSPWLIYEAGRMVERGIKLIPIRVDLSTTMLPRDYPLMEQSVDNTQVGIRQVVSTLNQVASRPLPPDLLDERFRMAWPRFSGRLERPHEVFSARTPQEQHFCQEVFLDIARESMTASCRSLALYSECSRIVALTDWSNMCGLSRKQEGSSKEQSTREKLAEEFVALRQMVQAALSDQQALAAEATKAAVVQLVEACDEVHDAINRTIDAQSSPPVQKEMLAMLTELVELSRTYRELRGLLASNRDSSGERGAGDPSLLPSPFSEKLKSWQETLPCYSTLEGGSDKGRETLKNSDATADGLPRIGPQPQRRTTESLRSNES